MAKICWDDKEVILERKKTEFETKEIFEKIEKYVKTSREYILHYQAIYKEVKENVAKVFTSLKSIQYKEREGMDKK